MRYFFFFFQRFGKKALFFLLLFSLFRLVFYLSYRSFFASEDTSTFILAALHGVRFDAVILFVSFGVLWWLEYLAYAWTRLAEKAWLRYIFFTIESVFLIFFLCWFFGDLVFFSFFERHMKNDFLDLMTNFSEVLSIGLVGYLPWIVLTLLALAIVVFCYWFLFYKKKLAVPRVTSKKLFALGFVTIFLLFFLLARGGWQKQVFIWQEIFCCTSQKGAKLTANAFLALYSFQQEKKLAAMTLLPKQQAIGTIQKLLSTDGVSFDWPENFPVARHLKPEKLYPSQIAKNYNVVVLVLESFLAEMIGSYRAEFKELTPNFDALVKRGLWFPNFFANGIYTKDGYAALMQGFPTLKNLSLYGSLYADRTFFNPFLSFKNHGYYSFAIHPFEAGSSYVSTTFHNLGIDAVYTKRDFPDYEKNSNKEGIKDEANFSFFLKRLQESPQPFLAIFHNTSTHTPFELDDPKWEIYGTATMKAKQKNALRYMDHFLGKFIEDLQRQPFAKKTLVVILGDHTMAADLSNYSYRARVPLLILMPDRSLHGVNEAYAMQTDFIPTLYDLLGFDANLSAFGSSLLHRKKHEGFALNSNYEENIWVEQGKLVVLDQAKILSYYDLEKDPATKHNLYPEQEPPAVLLNHYQAYIQTSQNLLLFNKLAPYP